VQWHPEWDVAHCAGSRAFFTLFGESLRAATVARH
jgi:gamma-glutamyl-gamma-aminobutyrate hydrolase PuuD